MHLLRDCVRILILIGLSGCMISADQVKGRSWIALSDTTADRNDTADMPVRDLPAAQREGEAPAEPLSRSVSLLRGSAGASPSLGKSSRRANVQDPAAKHDPEVVRLQSPSSDDVRDQILLASAEMELPPLPDASPPEAISETSQSPVSPQHDNPVGSTSTLPPNRGTNSSAFPVEQSNRGLSSIARNRQANRVEFASPTNRIGATSGSSSGRFGSSQEGLSPILRNRLAESGGANDQPQFDYPDIGSDPVKRYHDLYGVDEEHDPFLFPWLMNVIFEDRWLLAEKDPAKAVKNQLQRRTKIDIRDPDPDTANFPNGAYTLPKGRMYIETSPLGLYGPSISGNHPRTYQWESLIRYGLTDNLEFRLFSNGLTDQGSHGNQPGFVGFQPLAIDFKANFWEENTKYHVPAMGVEIYLQTKLLGSSAFSSGVQPSISLLFDQSLPLGVGFEYNFGYTGVQNSEGQIAYQFSYQWSFQREVVKDFDVFFHGFYNAAALPRLSQFQTASQATVPNVTVTGVGGIWTVNNRVSVFGSYNFGLTPDSPKSFALLGFAVAL